MPKVNCYCMNNVFTLSFQPHHHGSYSGYYGRMNSHPPLFFEIRVSDKPGEKFGYYPEDLPRTLKKAIAKAILEFESVD